jgi:hypothetical protein
MLRNRRNTFAIALLTAVAGMVPTGSALAVQNYLYVSGAVGVASTQSVRLSVTNLAPGDDRCRGCFSTLQCQMQLQVFDSQGAQIAQSSRLVGAGRTLSLQLDGSTIRGGLIRAQITTDPAGDKLCTQLMASTFEILNSTSGETQLFVPSAQDLSRGAQKTIQLQAQ